MIGNLAPFVSLYSLHAIHQRLHHRLHSLVVPRMEPCLRGNLTSDLFFLQTRHLRRFVLSPSLTHGGSSSTRILDICSRQPCDISPILFLQGQGFVCWQILYCSIYKIHHLAFSTLLDSSDFPFWEVWRSHRVLDSDWLIRGVLALPTTQTTKPESTHRASTPSSMAMEYIFYFGGLISRHQVGKSLRDVLYCAAPIVCMQSPQHGSPCHPITILRGSPSHGDTQNKAHGIFAGPTAPNQQPGLTPSDSMSYPHLNMILLNMILGAEITSLPGV